MSCDVFMNIMFFMFGNAVGGLRYGEHKHLCSATALHGVLKGFHVVCHDSSGKTTWKLTVIPP